MTYEPGQQVLVRGVACKQRGCVALTRLSGAEAHIRVDPADVVGPAPATPDEGRGTIRAISDDMYTFRAQRDEARAALAAAEARIAAVVALDAEEYTYNGLIAVEDLRRALSVEADE